jgi:hypothetical protein
MDCKWCLCLQWWRSWWPKMLNHWSILCWQFGLNLVLLCGAALPGMKLMYADVLWAAELLTTGCGILEAWSIL